VKPQRFAGQQDAATDMAMKLAVEGDLLARYTGTGEEQKKRIVVADFSEGRVEASCARLSLVSWGNTECGRSFPRTCRLSPSKSGVRLTLEVVCVAAVLNLLPEFQAHEDTDKSTHKTPAIALDHLTPLAVHRSPFPAAPA
jgi:hypothetical protein